MPDFDRGGRSRRVAATRARTNRRQANTGVAIRSHRIRPLHSRADARKGRRIADGVAESCDLLETGIVTFGKMAVRDGFSWRASRHRSARMVPAASRNRLER